jgi:hypothetical protein
VQEAQLGRAGRELEEREGGGEGGGAATSGHRFEVIEGDEPPRTQGAR